MPEYHEVLSYFLLCHWLCQRKWDLPWKVIVLWANISADEENNMKSHNKFATMCTPWTTAWKSYPAIVVLNLLSGHQCGEKLVIILTQPLSLHLLCKEWRPQLCDYLGPWTTASQGMGHSAWFKTWNTSELIFNPAFLPHPHINSIGLHTIPVSYSYMSILYRYPYCTNWVCSPIFDGHHKYGCIPYWPVQFTGIIQYLWDCTGRLKKLFWLNFYKFPTSLVSTGVVILIIV